MKRFIFPVCVFLIIFLLLGTLVFSKMSNPCGYLVDNGNHPIIACKCFGYVKNAPSKQPLSEEVFQYCYGIPKTKVCFSNAKPEMSRAEPYLCSDYPYTIEKSSNISQHPHYFYPTSKFTYDAINEKGVPIVLETKDSVNCNKIKAQGYYNQVFFGDGSGSTKENYRGFHFFAEKFVCFD